MFAASRQETGPRTSPILLRGGSVVWAGLQRLCGAALGVQLSVHLLVASFLRLDATGPAVFQRGMDVAEGHRQAGEHYEHDDHRQGPTRVRQSNFRCLQQQGDEQDVRG